MDKRLLWPSMDGYEPNYEVLLGLGLSQLAIACYRSLYEHGGATASELAVRLNKPSRNGLYEVLARLRTAQLINSYRYDGWSFHEYVPLNQALVARHRDERYKLAELIEYQQLRAKQPGEYV